MTGAIEFLRKAKAICKANEDKGCDGCPVCRMCSDGLESIDEADLVRKVMAYQIKEVSDEC